MWWITGFLQKSIRNMTDEDLDGGHTMAFQVFADGSANLPSKMCEGISLLPCDYTVDGVEQTYLGDVDQFDGHAYYEGLRAGKQVQTSLLNTHLFLTKFLPVLQQGLDVIYVSMSSGISGTYNAAVAAAKELMEEFQDRFVHIVDSHGCGFGSGLLAVRAAKLAKEGVDAREAARIVDEEVPHSCQYFTVDDLNFLKRTGRISGMTAKIGTVLNIKPILYGDSEGHIVSCGKTRGRKKAIDYLVKKFEEKRAKLQDLPICISHGDCPEDAKSLAEMIRSIVPDVPVLICQHEPFSGAHVGPGMLGLFFRGNER